MSSEQQQPGAEAPKQKSKEELEKEQQQAKEQLEALLSQSAPKNVQEGTLKGVNNILAGAVGAAGIAVLAPTVGMGAGLKNGGLIGGVFGLTGGAVVGLVGGAAVAVAGVGSGISQIVRGVLAQPKAMMAPRQGKWWNETTHEWVLTDLSTLEVPDNDKDLLEKLEQEVDAEGNPTGESKGAVKDTFYYDVLEVDPKAEPSAIKRKYYVMARKYHPDKADPNDAEAAEKFKAVSEAYQVLSDPALRKRYDEDGRDALSGDKTEANPQQVDPAILFAFLFGSDQFDDYVGRMATATSAIIGDSPKLSVKDARVLQERRCIRLAKKLVTKLESWVTEDYELAKTLWTTEGVALSKASYGLQMVHTIGMIYELAAVQFLGSTENGVGLPGISKWAQGQSARMNKKKQANKTQMDTLLASLDMMKMQAHYAQKMEAAKDDNERAEIQKELEEASAATMLKIMWTTSVVDITSTLHEVCQMVFFDQSVDKETRIKRAYGVKNLGKTWQEVPAPEGYDAKDAKTLYEEAAFAAMVETVKRKDEAAHAAGM